MLFLSFMACKQSIALWLTKVTNAILMFLAYIVYKQHCTLVNQSDNMIYKPTAVVAVLIRCGTEDGSPCNAMCLE